MATKITPGKTDLKTATANRKAIEAALLGGGTCELPAGEITLDRQVSLTPAHSFARLTGRGDGNTILRNLYNAYPENCTLWVYGDEITDPARGVKLGDVAEGQYDLPATVPPGLVYVTQGVSYIEGQYLSAMTGEFRRVLPGNALDRPLRRPYRAADRPDAAPAYAVPAGVARGLLVADLTFAQPVNNQASPLIGKYLYDCRFERVGFGLPDETVQRSGLNTSAHVIFRGCRSPVRMELNTCHDLTFEGCRIDGFYGEESCTDCVVRDSLVSVSGRTGNGVQWRLGSDRLRLENVAVEGAGVVAAGGAYMPLAVGGRECRLADVSVRASVFVPGYSSNYLSGDGCVLERLTSDLPVGLTGGQGWRLRDCDAAGWDLRAGTSGSASGCAGVPASW